MKIRFLAFLITLITIIAIEPLIEFLIIPIVKWTFLVVIAWFLSNLVKRRLILNHLGKIAPDGKAVLITGKMFRCP